MTVEGVVFNIQRFCTHDGPGIRTTVFLKGCPLHCAWCANPEALSPRPQLMVRDVKCVGCGSCAEACPENAISLSDDGVRVVDWKRCNHCFECVSACVRGALTAMGKTHTARSVAAVVERDKVFYDNSGGGATISGGEPLFQPEFLLALLRLLRQRGLHTALDTTGLAAGEVVDRVLPLVDLVLFDIKHLDPARHKELTGVDNALILENLRRVAEKARTWIRTPLVAGVNDSMEQVAAIADLAEELGVEKVSLLPFHEGGISKWPQIGRPPPDFRGQAPDDGHLRRLAEVVARRGLTVGVSS